MLTLKCSFKRLRQLGLQIWCLTKVRTRPAGRIGDFGNFFIVLAKSPLLLPYISHRSSFFPTKQSRYYWKRFIMWSIL